MAHDPQRQSPVLSQVVEVSEAHIASLPIHARRKLSRLAIQVALAFTLKLSHAKALSDCRSSCMVLLRAQPIRQYIA